MDVTLLTRLAYEVLGQLALLAAAVVTGFGVMVALITTITEVIPDERRDSS